MPDAAELLGGAPSAFPPGRGRRQEAPAHRLPVGEDAADRSERRTLWAWIDSTKQGWVPLKELVGKLLGVMLERGVQSLAGNTPESFRARAMLGRAVSGGKTAITLWRQRQVPLLKLPDLGLGRLGALAVEGGPEFGRVLQCVNQYIVLNKMFRELDDGDRMVKREEFLSATKGRVFWEQLQAFLKESPTPLGSRETTYEQINSVFAGARADDEHVTFDELAAWAMMRLMPPLEGEALAEALSTPLPASVLKLSGSAREEMKRGGGTAWLGPVGASSDGAAPAPRAHRSDQTSYFNVHGVEYNAAKYVTPAHGFGKYTERQPIFANEASQAMSTVDGAGLQRAYEGEDAHFRIVTRDARMRNTTLGEPEVQVKGPAEVAYKVVAYSAATARKMGLRHGKGGAGVYIVSWRAQVAGDYLIKARLTSSVGVPLLVKKVTVKSAPIDGSDAALRSAAVADLRVVLSAEAQRQAERELGRMRQHRLREGPEWLRSHAQVVDAVLKGHEAASKARAGEAPPSPSKLPPSAGASPAALAAAEKEVSAAERSVVAWRLRLRSAQVRAPDPKRIATRLALPKDSKVLALVEPGEPGAPAWLELAFHLADDQTAEALATFLRVLSAASAAALAGLEPDAVVAFDPPSILKELEVRRGAGGGEGGAGGGGAGAGDELQQRVVRLLVQREKLEEEAMERSEVGATHDLNFVALAHAGSGVAFHAVREALQSASADSEHNRLQAAVLQWQDGRQVHLAEEAFDAEEKRPVVKRPPDGTLLMHHKGKLYFCAQPLHFVLADFASEGKPRLVPAAELGLPAWAFERDAWQIVARGPAAAAGGGGGGAGGPTWPGSSPRRRPKSAPPPWHNAYPKAQPGKFNKRNGGAPAAELPPDAFKQRARAAPPV